MGDLDVNETDTAADTEKGKPEDPKMKALNDEIKAMKAIDRALGTLPLGTQGRVLNWAAQRQHEAQSFRYQREERAFAEKCRNTDLIPSNGLLATAGRYA